MKARNPETGMCLDTMARSIGSELGVSPCHGMGGNQVCNVHKRTDRHIDNQNCPTSVWMIRL